MNRLYANKPDEAGPRIVEVLVHRLRKKLPEDLRVETIRGIGYRLVSTEAAGGQTASAA